MSSQIGDAPIHDDKTLVTMQPISDNIKNEYKRTIPNTTLCKL